MRFDLKSPCKNCPFRSDGTGIQFACRERAEDIEESAYRWGFPCHRTATLVEDSPYEERDGYHFGEDTQYCIGHAIFELHNGCQTPWPGIGNDEDLVSRLLDQVDMTAPVFQSREAFLDAHTTPSRRGA